MVEGMVRQVLDAAAEKGASRITRIRIGLGELSGLEDSSVRLYFESAAEGTIAESAELVIDRTRAELKCSACGEVFERKKDQFNCPECGSASLSVLSGKEMTLRDIEVEG